MDRCGCQKKSDSVLSAADALLNVAEKIEAAIVTTVAPTRLAAEANMAAACVTPSATAPSTDADLAVLLSTPAAELPQSTLLTSLDSHCCLQSGWPWLMAWLP